MSEALYVNTAPVVRSCRTKRAPPQPCRIGRRVPVREEGRSVFASYDFTDPIDLAEFLGSQTSVKAHHAAVGFLS